MLTTNIDNIVSIYRHGLIAITRLDIDDITNIAKILRFENIREDLFNLKKFQFRIVESSASARSYSDKFR